MGVIKGQTEHRKWKNGKRLTRRQAILANCFICNGMEDSREDCMAEASCPIYIYSPYGNPTSLKR